MNADLAALLSSLISILIVVLLMRADRQAEATHRRMIERLPKPKKERR